MSDNIETWNYQFHDTHFSKIDNWNDLRKIQFNVDSYFALRLIFQFYIFPLLKLSNKFEDNIKKLYWKQ